MTSEHVLSLFRWCCYTMPEGSFVSETNKAVIVFRSQLTNDVGFKLRVRTSGFLCPSILRQLLIILPFPAQLPARTTPAPVLPTTTGQLSSHRLYAPTTVYHPYPPFQPCQRQWRERICGPNGARGRSAHAAVADAALCLVFGPVVLRSVCKWATNTALQKGVASPALPAAAMWPSTPAPFERFSVNPSVKEGDER